jgi:hypothetical protein
VEPAKLTVGVIYFVDGLGRRLSYAPNPKWLPNARDKRERTVTFNGYSLFE